MADLGFEQKNPTVIYEDNQGAIALATNPGYHARTKHVDIRHHFVREKVLAGDIKVIYKETEHQLADILTKALGTKRFSTSAPEWTSRHVMDPSINSEWEC